MPANRSRWHVCPHSRVLYNAPARRIAVIRVSTYVMRAPCSPLAPLAFLDTFYHTPRSSIRAMAASMELVSFKDVMASLEAERPPLEFGATQLKTKNRSGLALRDNVQTDVRGSGIVRGTLDAETEPGCASTELDPTSKPPTPSDCASTELDPTTRPPTPESPGAVARRIVKKRKTSHGQRPQYHDDLLDAALDASSGDSCWLSDQSGSGTATEDEAQSHKLKRQKTQPEQLQEHWTMNETLLQGVEDMLASCIHQPWYDGSFFYSSGQMKPWTFEACAFEIANYVMASIQGHCICYKIGITENPVRRWKMYQAETKYGHRWSKMVLLYWAPTSKKHHPESSGNMETRLVADFFNSDLDSACVNRPGSGGECPSHGRPHFVYAAVCE